MADCSVRIAESIEKVLRRQWRASVVALTDASQNVVARWTYDSWGTPKEYNVSGQEVSVGTAGNLHLYAGYRYDTETGLYFLKTRYYNPRLGRFISKDPLNAGSDTISVNPYVYARNNPVNLVDPTGQFDVYGYVRNTSGAGLAAAVRICNVNIQGGNYIQGDYGNVYYTDSSGRFKFTLIPEGIYNMYYDAEGYQSQIQELITVTGNTATPTVRDSYFKPSTAISHPLWEAKFWLRDPWGRLLVKSDRLGE